MALPNSSSSPSSSSKPTLSPTSPLPSKSPHFTPIHEGEKLQKEINDENAPTTPNKVTYKQHQRTPLHKGKTGKSQPKRDVSNDDVSVACNSCRPHPRERISVVPLDGNSRHSFPSPNGVIKSLLSTLSRKSPRSTSSDMSPSTAAREEQWKITLAELSQRLVQVTRKRDEAILEASRLKHSIAELEKKLNRLELYCHNLKSGLEEQFRSLDSTHRTVRNNPLSTDGRLIGDFLNSVSEARSTVRNLSRSLITQARSTGSTKVYEKIAMLLQPYDIKISTSAKNQRELVFYLEALLNKTFFEDFETASFWRYSETTILNPTERCEANRAAYSVLHALTWEEVLSKGTRHFSEEFSKFCDRRMSEVVAMLGWTRAWTEGLLQAFFDASKSVWLVHLLANSVYPALGIFRVDKIFQFDPVYMEDIEADRIRSRLVPAVVRIMVAPGFYVYDNVIKCKVLCRYYSISHGGGFSDEKVLVTSL